MCVKGYFMQNIVGSTKKVMAGILCVLGLFFISTISHANDSSTTAKDSGVAVSGESGITANLSETNTPTSKSGTATPAAGAEQQSTQHLAPASPAKHVPGAAKTNSASQLASLIGGLALILVLIYGLSWFVKRFSQGGFLHNPTMKIVSAMPLGTRERLMLVEIGGKQLLLGVTATQINTLHVFDEPVVLSEKEQPVASDFSQKLMAILQQKNITSAGSHPDKKSNS
jgi:flagellar protein FliO/FliZ